MANDPVLRAAVTYQGVEVPATCGVSPVRPATIPYHKTALLSNTDEGPLVSRSWCAWPVGQGVVRGLWSRTRSLDARQGFSPAATRQQALPAQLANDGQPSTGHGGLKASATSFDRLPREAGRQGARGVATVGGAVLAAPHWAGDRL